MIKKDQKDSFFVCVWLLCRNVDVAGLTPSIFWQLLVTVDFHLQNHARNDQW